MVLDRYREVLALPGALAFSAAGVVARAPMAMVGISLILMVRMLYGSYSLAGAVSAVSVISFAIGAPILARLVDRFGQARTMIPAILISATSLIVGIFAALHLMPPIYLMVLASISGFTSGSMGALVRARWAVIVKGPGQLQAAYALEAAFDELVFVLGPVAATLLTAAIHPAAGLWTAVVLMVTGSFAFLLQTKTQPPVSKHQKGVRQESVMRNPAMIVLASTFVGTGALFGATDLSVVAFTDELGRSQLAGIILATMSFGSLISAVIYGARVWKTPMARLFLISVGLLAAGVSTFYFAPSLWVLMIFMFIAGLMISPTLTNVNTAVEKITPPRRLTEGLTWMSTAMTVGVSLGSALTGPVIDSHGHSGGFVMTVIFGWVMFLAAAVGVKALKNALDKDDLKKHEATIVQTESDRDGADGRRPDDSFSRASPPAEGNETGDNPDDSPGGGTGERPEKE